MIRSNRGEVVDMDALRSSNSSQIAVSGGGIRMNANGDIIDSDGTVLKSAEEMNNETPPRGEGSSRVSLADMRKVRDSNPEAREAAQRARKLAKKVEINTSALVTNNQPIIRDYTSEDAYPEQTAPVEQVDTTDLEDDQVIPLKKRRMRE